MLIKTFWAVVGLLTIAVSVASAGSPDERLRTAIETGDAAAVRTALRDGADANESIGVKGFDGGIFFLPAVIFAARSVDRYPDVVTALIEGGADPNAALPFPHLSTKGHPRLLTLLISMMQRQDAPLVMERMMQTFSAVVDAGADVNWPHDMNDEGMPSTAVFYPIHEAAMIPLSDCAIRACTALLDRGANVNQRDVGMQEAEQAEPQSGLTPLMFASVHWYDPTSVPLDRSDIVRFLVGRGADIDATAGGYSALHAAVASPLTVRTLLELGARTDSRDDRGLTPFGAALMDGDAESALIIYRHERAQRNAHSD